MDVGLLMSILIGCALVFMAACEYAWARRRKKRSEEQEDQWYQTHESIRNALAQTDRQQTVIQDVRLRAISNRALLAQVCESTATAIQAPAAVITVVEHEGQRWLAFYGADWCPEEPRSGLMMPLDTSYCQYVVTTEQPLVITDSLHDYRIARNSIATKGAVRAYLGAPVRTADGTVVGSLCVFDQVPRKWSMRERAVVEAFAAIVVL